MTELCTFSWSLDIFLSFYFSGIQVDVKKHFSILAFFSFSFFFFLAFDCWHLIFVGGRDMYVLALLFRQHTIDSLNKAGQSCKIHIS